MLFELQQIGLVVTHTNQHTLWLVTLTIEQCLNADNTTRNRQHTTYKDTTTDGLVVTSVCAVPYSQVALRRACYVIGDVL